MTYEEYDEDSEEWYKGYDNIGGIYVMAVIKTNPVYPPSIISGQLSADGSIHTTGHPIQILRRVVTVGGDTVWDKDPIIDKVVMLWDGTAWIEVPLDQGREGDYLLLQNVIIPFNDIKNIYNTPGSVPLVLRPK